LSTTDVGNAFRDRVCALLRTKYLDAQVEQRIAGTKVDIRFTAESDFGGRKVFAVECKDYATPLTKSILAQQIRPYYNPMLESHEVDEVLIVSSKPLGADASEFMNSWRNATHKTYEELAESLLGLGPYINDLAQIRPTDDMPYIEARIATQPGNAIDLVDEWVRQSSSHGLAIRGSYGQGKTSFAKRLAALYAQRHLEDASQRMPILYRLGEVVHETRLEALFGAMFTSQHVAAGYRYSTFEHLNHAGRLLVILDGFDEMKHAMTAADFYANFKEFNRLLSGDAKVVLLGRPNALPSDVEELVFRGRDQVAGQIVASAVFQPWEEWRLDFFTLDETRQLLALVLEKFSDDHSRRREFSYPEGFLSKRVTEIIGLVPADLLSRPVHVHLVAELGADPNFDFHGFNAYKLYDHFIRTMVERDVEKKTRRAIPLDARLTFQRELAWWAWSRLGSSQGHFLRKNVPMALLKELPAGNSVDDEGKLNEYIVSTLTEEKESGALYFAHRSFQEFLVAERVRAVVPTPAGHLDYSAYITDDVMTFLLQAPQPEYIINWYGTLRASSGPLTQRYLRFLASSPTLVHHIRESELMTEIGKLDSWTVFILTIAMSEETAHALSSHELRPFLNHVVKSGSSAAAAAATLGLLKIYRGHLQPPELIDISASLLERCLRRCRPESGRDSLTFEREDWDFSAKWMGNDIKKVFPAHSETTSATLEFDLFELQERCMQQLFGTKTSSLDESLRPLGPLFSEKAVVPVRVEARRTYDHIDKKYRDPHLQLLQARKPSFIVVEVGYARRPGRSSG